MVSDEILDELAAALPDAPRWVAPRGLMREHRCDVLFGPEGRRGAGYLVLEPGEPEAFAVHRPVASLAAKLAEVGQPVEQVLATIEGSEPWRALLPGWRELPVVVHVHPSPESLPRPQHPTRLLTLADLDVLDSLPEALAHELQRALSKGPVAGAVHADRPVAFGYAPYRTESWFDLSIDTLPEHRRAGYATAAAAHLIHHMLAQGKRPVWGAFDADVASMAMAKKYGFRAVDRMMMFVAPGVKLAS
jgi:GNAT superfamily N-acetyltransferase